MGSPPHRVGVSVVATVSPAPPLLAPELRSASAIKSGAACRSSDVFRVLCSALSYVLKWLTSAFRAPLVLKVARCFCAMRLALPDNSRNRSALRRYVADW